MVQFGGTKVQTLSLPIVIGSVKKEGERGKERKVKIHSFKTTCHQSKNGSY